MTRPKLCVVSTIATPLRVFMGPHIRALSTMYDIVLICDGTQDEVADLLNEHVRFVRCPIQRRISLGKDLACLLWLRRFFLREGFTAVHSIMPKSGLLGMLAARLTGVPMRFHAFTGQVWATRTGLIRMVLKNMDRLLAASASRLLTDSPSQRQYLIDQHVVTSNRIEVLAEGSICGVDTERFRRQNDVRQRIRQDLGISPDALVYLYLGRVTYEKGIPELLEAFVQVAAHAPDAWLLIVGPSEADLDRSITAAAMETGQRIRRIGFTKTPEHYMAAADVFCLPSHREGFGTVIIEAAAAGLPAIASRIYGVTDAVIEGATGLLHSARNVAEIATLMAKLGDLPELRHQLGDAARSRAEKQFNEAKVVQALLDFYVREAARCGIRLEECRQ